MSNEKKIEIQKSILYNPDNTLMSKRMCLDRLYNLDTITNLLVYWDYYFSLVEEASKRQGENFIHPIKDFYNKNYKHNIPDIKLKNNNII